MLQLADIPFEALAALPLDRTLLLLPVGATEAHGPHLPLGTDVIIADAMTHAAGAAIEADGWVCAALPPLAYTAADFAAGFAGTVSVSPEVVTAVIADIARSLARHGLRRLVLVNSHLDPTHVASLRAAAETIEAEAVGEVLFPDVTRKPWALRLSDEFKSGACHAGRYEGSIVLAERPELVDSVRAAKLAPNPSSLSTAIRAGQSTFEDAGGPLAYFGDPAAATADEGRDTVTTLGRIVADAVRERWGVV